MDETAKAIARLREEAKPEKTSRSERLASDDSMPHMRPTGSGIGARKAGGIAPAASTKRPKTIGS